MQVLIAFTALSAVYGLALNLGLTSAFGDESPSLWNVIGSVVSILAYGVILLLLQRYYEYRNGRQVAVSAKRYAGIAATGASLAAFIGFVVVVLLIAMAFSRL